MEHRPLRLGIVGGSISTGCCLPSFFESGSKAGNDSFAGLLAQARVGGMPLQVSNQAEGASGSSLASYCALDWFDADEPLDYLLIEFAANDLYLSTSSCHSADAKLLDTPKASMERLLLNWRAARPTTALVILHVCGPSKALRAAHCDDHDDNLTAAYGAHGISLRRSLSPEQFSAISWDRMGIHPDAAGHRAIADLVLDLLRQHASASASAGSALPLAHSPPAAGLARDAWRCRMCRSDAACPALRPMGNGGAGGGFRLSGRQLSYSHIVKVGWVGNRTGDEVSFHVGRARPVLLGLLCSYENVGVANVSLDHVSHQIDLQWRKKSSQMCVMPFAGDGASGVLSIRVASRDHGARAPGQADGRHPTAQLECL